MTEKETKLPPLHQAALEGNSDKVKQLLDDGADIKERDDDGNTALHFAAGRSIIPIVQVLINAGVDIFACNNDKHTAINLAIELHGCKNDLANFLYVAMEKRGGRYWEKAKEELDKAR